MNNKKHNRSLRDAGFTILILIFVFGVNLLIGSFYNALSLVPMISVLGVFLISLGTIGYVWGIVAAIVNVFAVNYAFTFPYYAFNFSLPENLFSSIYANSQRYTSSDFRSDSAIVFSPKNDIITDRERR